LRSKPQTMRAAARESVTRDSAIELLRLLSEFQSILPKIRRAWTGIPTQPEVEVPAVLDELRKAGGSTVRLLPKEVQDRWFYLIDRADELRSAQEEEGNVEEDRSAWTEQKIGRSRADVLNYSNYVRASLLAVVQSRDVPATVDPPVLRRIDMVVWHTPDEAHLYE